MATPVHVVPTFQALYFDGTNTQELLDWLQTEITDTIPTAIEVWWMRDVEKVWIGYNNWVIASLADPPRVAELLPDDLFRMKYAVHPGTVTAPPPPPEPEPEPEGAPA
ncbi:hypothetical protein E1091_18520 [Micromonospora fluostatini]|uniref:Uncharacterized protein n=1 Tax=Micromonospora fluostatini TaxID=1629071 RepID=A0ABY2DCB5_9ACTN|nr:hypothetical protein E1091_18520 [Micromonospora fluostatini]